MTKGQPCAERAPLDDNVQTQPTKRRVQLIPTKVDDLEITNLFNGEVVHYRCLLITGKCPAFENSKDDRVSVKVKDHFTTTSAQDWPIFDGCWKALVMLSAGENDIQYQHQHFGGTSSTKSIKVTYIPLTQNPSVHLAVLISRNNYSGEIDRDPGYDVLSELRMNAYIWQALIAEDMRIKGFGRRSFRLEEGYMVDTTRGPTTTVGDTRPLRDSIAKVFVARSDMSVPEIEAIGRQNTTGWSFHFGCADSSKTFNQVVSGASKRSRSAYALPKDAVVLGAVLDPTHWSQLMRGSPRNLAETSTKMLNLGSPALDMPTGTEGLPPSIAGRCCPGLQTHVFRQLRHALGVWSLPFDLDGPPTGVLDLQFALVARRSLIFRLPGDDPRTLTTEFSEGAINTWLDIDNDLSTPRGDDAPDDAQTPRNWLMNECEAGIVRALYYDNNGKPSGSSDTLTSKADYGSLGCKQLSEELNVAKVPL